jgi:2'-5' RNA ligase
MKRAEKKRATQLPARSVAMPPLRVFCAIELPSEVRARVIEHTKLLRDAAPEVRASWERAEKLHLTLKFLGEIAPNRIEALSDAASRAAQNTQPFILTLEGAGAFPTRGLPRILWLGVNDSSGVLSQLQKHLEEECESVGFAREERPFHPHLTIARIRTPTATRQLARLHQEIGFVAIDFPVKELVVMRSELGPGGSNYKEISRHRLEPKRCSN